MKSAPDRTGIASRSKILSALDGFISAVARMLGGGLFARIFTSARRRENSSVKEGRAYSFRRHAVEKLENSFFSYVSRAAAYRFLTCRLKVMGVFLFSFAAYTGVYTLIMDIIGRRGISPFDAGSGFVLSVLLLVSSIPLISSKKTVSRALIESRIMRRVLPALGLKHDFPEYSAETGRLVPALLLGLSLGSLTFFFTPSLIVAALLAVPAFYLIMVKPEFGTVTLFFITPFFSARIVACLLVVVLFSYAVKVFRGKREMAVGVTDLFVLIFAFLTLFSGVVSFAGVNAGDTAVNTLSVLGFFVIASVRQTRSWLRKFTLSAVGGASIAAMIGIVSYFARVEFGIGDMTSSFFGDLFGGTVSGSLLSGSFTGYLVLVVPIAFSMLISGEFIRRYHTLFFVALIASCLFICGDFVSLFAVAAALFCLALFWHRRALWLVFGGIAAIPALSFLVPRAFAEKVFSAFGIFDFLSGRVEVWRGVFRMIGDFFFSGVGAGGFSMLWSEYAPAGVGGVPRSYNFFLQIFVEGGVFAVFVFAVILFLALRSSLTLFSDLSSSLSVDPSMLLVPRGDGQGRRTAGKMIRMAAAGPFCGALALLIRGTVDYSGADRGLTFCFWLVFGLSVAFVKNGREYLPSELPDSAENSPFSSDLDIKII